MKKLSCYILLIFSLLSSFSVAQEHDDTARKRFSERIFFGGNIGLQFGTVTFIDVSPLIGYELTEKLSAGVGATYQYYRYRDRFNDFSTNIYGGRVFSRYNILKNIFSHVEYEVLNLEAFDLEKRINVTSILVGGGFRQQLGGRTYLNLLVLWNINESAYSPYRNPIIRGGISIGL